MNRKLISIFFLIALVSCQKKTEIRIENIEVPKYYREYDFQKFSDSKLKLKGFKINHSIRERALKRIDLKDSVSKNFLTISEILNGLLSSSKNVRISYLKEEQSLKLKTTNENYEVYQGNGKSKDDITDKDVSWFKTYFLIKKDSVCFMVNYCSEDNDLKKIKDYQNMISRIENECSRGSVFKTSTKNSPTEKVIEK